MKKISSLRQILRIIDLTSIKDKYNLAFLTIFVFFTSCFEVLSVSLIVPTYKILIDKQTLAEAIPLKKDLNISFNSYRKEEFFALTLFALVFVLSNSLKTYVNWKAGKLTASIGASLFSKAYSKVLCKPYGLLSRDNLSRYSSNFLTTNTYFVAVLKNIILLINYASTCILLFVTLIYLNSQATIIAILLLVIPYYILTKITRPILTKVSRKIAFLHEDINRYIQEGFKFKDYKTFQSTKILYQYFLQARIKVKRKNCIRRIS